MAGSFSTKLRNRRFGFDSQYILALSNIIINILCVVIIGLAAHNIVYVTSPSARNGSTLIRYNVTVNDTELSLNRTVAYLPQDLRLGSYWLMLSWGVGGFILEVVLGSLLLSRHLGKWKAEQAARQQGTPRSRSRTHPDANPFDLNKKPQTQISIVIAIICLCWSIAATTWAFIQWQQSGKFDPSEDLFLESEQYSSKRNQGFFTPDAWTCQYEDYVYDREIQSSINQICIEGTSLRVIQLVSTILGVALLAALVWRTTKRSANKEALDSLARGEIEYEESTRGRSRSRRPESTNNNRESLAPTIVEKDDSHALASAPEPEVAPHAQDGKAQ